MKTRFMKTIATFVATAAIAALLVVPVGAADPEANSDAKVKFIPGELEFSDSLSAPAFDFGDHNIDGKALTYSIGAGVTNTVTPVRGGSITDKLSITDNRGSMDGWTLNVKLGDFTQGSTTVMENTKIKLNVTAMTTEADNDSAAPSVFADILLAPNGAAQTIAKAAGGTGRGTWTAIPDKMNATITIPSKDIIKDETTNKLVWTIVQSA